MAKQKTTNQKEESKTISINENSVGTRGRIFEGIVAKKFPTRVVIEFERTVFVQKYERFYKKQTRLHARLPDSMKDMANVGDLIQIRECRPLSKIIHFIVVKVIKTAQELKENKVAEKKQ